MKDKSNKEIYTLTEAQQKQLKTVEFELIKFLPKLKLLYEKYKNMLSQRRNQENAKDAYRKIIHEIVDFYSMLLEKNLLMNHHERRIDPVDEDQQRQKVYLYFVIVTSSITNCLEIYGEKNIQQFIAKIMEQLVPYIGYDKNDHEVVINSYYYFSSVFLN